MIARIRIVVVDPVDGPPSAAYLGDDAAKADAVFEREAANPRNENVRLIVYPNHQRIRFPAQEAPLLAQSRPAGTAAPPKPTPTVTTTKKPK